MNVHLKRRIRQPFYLLVLCVLSCCFATTIRAHDDAAMDAEHDAMLALVPVAQATHLATSDGNWSSPSTWSTGTVPANDARVVIPLGRTVTYDANSAASIRWLLVNGKLVFARNITTSLLIDTIVVDVGGSWEQGTSGNPIQADVKSTVTFSDSGAIDRVNDPKEMGRGLLAHGETSIYGATKTTFLPVSGGFAQGSSTLSLASAPVGWRVGDRIVLNGVKTSDVNYTWIEPAGPQLVGQPTIVTQDEVRLISSVSGNSISLNAPLSFDHTPIAPFAGFRTPRVYLTNFTRNIEFKSANVDGSTHAMLKRRGHMMFMHNNNVSVNFASFNDLGRTNKAVNVDDLVSYVKDGGERTPGLGTNMAGRYALHFHRSGNDPKQKPVISRGNTVFGATSWGIVNHQSNALVEDCAVYNAPAAAFVEETGNGIGAFRRNIALSSRGTARSDSLRGDGSIPDLAHSGIGFAFRGNYIFAEDNVASGCNFGFAWMNKHHDDSQQPGARDPIPVSALRNPYIANGRNFNEWWDTPTQVFRRNEGVACGVGFGSGNWVFWSAAAPMSDVRQQMIDCIYWNNSAWAADVNYSAHVTYRNVLIHGDPDNAKSKGGLSAETNNNENLFDNVKVTGFDFGLSTAEVIPGQINPPRYHVFTNCDFTSGNNRTYGNGAPDNITFYDKNSLNLNTLSFAGQAQPMLSESEFYRSLWVSGIKTDPLGTYEITARNGDNDPFRFTTQGLLDTLARGYYTRTDGSTFITLPVVAYNRVTEVSKTYWYEMNLNPADYPNTIGANLGRWTNPGSDQVGEISFNAKPGIYAGNQYVTLSTSTAGATIRYTIDGTLPTASSPIYTSPILATNTMTLAARGFKSGMIDAPADYATYAIGTSSTQSPTPTPTPTATPTPTPIATPTPTPTPMTGTGSITREVWSGVTGTIIASIPLTKVPSSIGTLNSFESPTNVADNYGQRVRGFITAPVTGSYTFWIAGDDNCALYLSTNDQASGKVKIASVSGWTSSRQWNKYTQQKSAAITLTAGQKYYVEALMKEAKGGDNLAVGWAKPGQSTTTPSEVIPGVQLSPFS